MRCAGGPFADTNRKEANASGFRVDRLGLKFGGAWAQTSREFARATRAAGICSQAASSDPSRSMPRQASFMTAASKPSRAPSMAEYATQKSAASPVEMLRSFS